ncbi:uncharacterized protein SPPG_05925 [Spizellomyces punctatus DAOM BR117]|uniref:DUF676 domain-containing protein n=1 Tax=Spizellomyces punctatus (strain DAOM BR117) TaxID=645134 RepID=A0A0L0HDB6_SPIPD|nr:uncharacterized protein SPPG_05925 [Spizellomyces punctatus DAOM BR117]KNC98969.1 hypothetical protein SPPG_05925 [Spizellomyces punctatus DAOM BR117]|eukprot:XP_016607009.1 hypothetical protein SPPG_05925 [Spizellomyces punctatus DAOM BR117]
MTVEPNTVACEPPLPPLPRDKRKVLLVFIHGFLGSEESFFGFPEHLVVALEKRHGFPTGKIETKMFPRYDTRGHNGQSVRKLMKWLEIYATTVRYECVILMAHSMGGLLAADAYQWMYALHKEKVEERLERADAQAKVDGATTNVSPTTATGTAGVSSWFGRWGRGNKKEDVTVVNLPPTTAETATPLDTSPESFEQDGFEGTDEHSPDSGIRFLVNIRGIITFDSPFYGLHTNVITQAGTNKAYAIMTEGIFNAKAYIPAAMETVTAYAPKTIEVPTGLPMVRTLPVRTAWVIDAAKKAVGRSDPPAPPPPSTSEIAALIEMADQDVKGVSESTPTSTPTQPPSPEPTPTTTESAEAKEPATNISTEAAPTKTTSSMPGWARYALGGAAVAAAAYTTVSVAPLAAAYIPASMIATSLASHYVISGAEQIRDHLHFLYPLVNSHRDMHQRVEMMRREMELRKRLTFKGFYVELPPLTTAAVPASATGTAPTTTPTPTTTAPSAGPTSASGVPTSARTSAPSASPTNNRHFCNLPPPETAHLFEPVGHPCLNEIDAHMGLFSSEYETYAALIVKAADAVKAVLEKETGRRGDGVLES